MSPMGNVVALAQETGDGYQELGSVTSYQEDEYHVTLSLSRGEKIRVQFYKEDMIRIYMDPTGEFQEYPTPQQESHTKRMVAKDFEDYINSGLAVKPDVSDEGGVITISSGPVQLKINKDDALMTLIKDDKVVWEEVKPLRHKAGSTVQSLKNHEGEYFFGGGMQNGRFTHRGQKIRIVNENGWTDGRVTSPAPFYWSTKGYGVIRNTFKPGEYDFGSVDIETVSTTHNENKMDAIYFLGDNPEEILGQYTDISGKPELQTEFSFYPAHLNAYNRDTWVEDPNGYLFEDGKRYKEYQPAQLGNRVGTLETLNGDDQFSGRAVINRYIANDMPLGWFLPNDGYGAGYGQTDSLDGDIENLRQFTEYANAHGIETGLWTQSSLHPKDPENPQKGERDINKEINEAGVRALKTDVAWVGPGYSFGLDGIDDVSNIFADSNIRSTIVTLDGWVGTHRYGNVWSGDQSGGQWEYIRFHIPTYIGSGLSSLVNVSSDMDGIFGGSPLIMTRDTQWKTFTSMMLYMDGWGSYQKNPWEHGEPYASINRNYLKLKTELLPYHYSINKEAADTGVPYLKAMFLEYPNEYTYSTATQYQYLFGDNFLVAPVYQDTQMDPNTYADIRNGIYLPEGETWIDYLTGQQYEGGQILNGFEAPLWKLPVFVKNDSIIPMYKPSNNPSEIDRSYRIFDIYAEEFAEFEVYEDDGKSLDYKNGESATTYISSKVEEGTLTVSVQPTKGYYPEMVSDRTTEFRVNVSKQPESIKLNINGKEVELTPVSTLEEYENSTNVYFYNEAPEFNRFSTEGSSFEDVEIKKTPSVYVKVDKTNVRENAVELVVEGFENKNVADVTATELPAIPSNFRAQEVSFDSIILAWDQQDNTDTYEIEFEGQIYTNIKDLTFDILDLESDKEYSFRVRARNTLGVSEWSEEITVKTELDPLRNAIKVENATLSATDQSGTPFNNMFDFDISTQWHTTWGMSQTPFSGVIDLGKIYQLDQLEYYPREDAGNGTITSYSIDISLDGRHWITGSDLSWERSGTTKIHEFGDAQARYIRINVKDAVGGFGAGREFYILKDDNTEGRLLGDTNASNTVDASDLTFFTNYAGLTTVDNDWEGYVSSYDYNLNGVIDAYDINLVQTIAAKRNYQEIKNIAGNLIVNKDKESVAKGETVTLSIDGVNLYDLNAFSVELGYNDNDFEVVSNNPQGKVESWESFSKVRTHTDGSKDIYVIYGSATANSISGDATLATVTLRALKDIEVVDIPVTHSSMVDSNLFEKAGDAQDGPLEGVRKIPNTAITVSGDEKVYENKYGSPLSKVNDGDRSTYAELMWHHGTNLDENGNIPDYVTLPQDITLSVDESIEKLHHITVVKRPNGNGSLKDIEVKVYNGDEIVFTGSHTFKKDDTLVEINTGNVPATKVVVTVLNSYSDKVMMTIGEIELYADYSQELAPKISHTDITVSGRDNLYEINGNEPLSNVNDGDRNSQAALLWDYEPNWDENGNLPEEVKLPQDITLTPNRPIETLNNITIVKRPGSNGSLKDVEITVYNGEEVVATKTHTFQYEDDLAEISMDNVPATKVVVTVLNTYDDKNTMMTIREIELYGQLGEIPQAPVDPTELFNVLTTVETVLNNSNLYTPESIDALYQAVTMAQDIIMTMGETQEAYDEAARVMQEAIDALEEIPTDEVDTSDLEALVEEAQALETEGYTEESVNALTQEIEAAKAILEQEALTQEEIDAAKESLQSAIEALEEIPADEIDTSALETLVEEALAIETEGYTEESVNALTQEIEAAKAVLEQETLTQEEVDAIKESLQSAIEALEEIPEDGVDRSVLEALVEEALAIETEGYTEESVNALTQEIEAAKAVLEQETLTQEEVDAAKETLQSAIEALEEIAADDETTNTLESLVEEALSIETEGYTEDSVTALTQAIEKAQELLAQEELTYNAVNEAAKELQTALDELAVDTSALEALVEKAQTIEAEDYTEESVSALTQAIEKAQGVLEQEEVTYNAVSEAAAELQTAMDSLVNKPVEDKPVENNPEVVESTNEDETVTATYMSDAFDTEVKLVAERLNQLTLDGYEVHDYEIHFVDVVTGEEVQPLEDKMIKISLPLSGLSQEGLKVGHILVDGSHETIAYSVDGEKVVFLADSFSVYYLASPVSEDQTPDVEDSTIPQEQPESQPTTDSQEETTSKDEQEETPSTDSQESSTTEDQTESTNTGAKEDETSDKAPTNKLPDSGMNTQLWVLLGVLSIAFGLYIALKKEKA